MPCLLIAGLLSMPRLILVLVALFSDYLSEAFQGVAWPILGFIFAPTTTLAWAWMEHSRDNPGGVHLLIVLLAAALDLGIIGGGRSWFLRRDR